MAIDYNRQYVGARYVPKFFENVNGSWDWAEGFQYEPLTIVRYGDNSYTSKKLVPDTVGSPNLNPEYWANTGNYNGFINSAEERISTLENNQFIFPENFGAAGNGIIDDSESIENAILAAQSQKKILFLRGVYFINKNISLQGKSIVIKGSSGRVESTLGGVPDRSVTLLFGAEGSITTTRTCSIKCYDCVFKGINKGFVIESFGNLFMNCAFVGFRIAIEINKGINWQGIEVNGCEFIGITDCCIVSNHSTDGKIINNGINGYCNQFLRGTFSGYSVIANHDNAKLPWEIRGDKMLISQNYFGPENGIIIDTYTPITITDNRFTMSGNAEFCIKATANQTISGWVITGNSINGEKTDIPFIVFEDITYLANSIFMNNYTFNKELLSVYNFNNEAFFNQCYINMCKANVRLSDGLLLITNQIYLNGCELNGYIRVKITDTSVNQTIGTEKIISPISCDIFVNGSYKESVYASNGSIRINKDNYNTNDVLFIKWNSFLP